MIYSFIIIIIAFLILFFVFWSKHKKIPSHEIVWDFIFQSILLLTGANLVYNIASPGNLLFPELAPYQPIYLFSVGVLVLYTSSKRLYEKIKKGK